MAEQNPPTESFPSTKPALWLKTSFTDRHPCGDIWSGSNLVAVPLPNHAGTVESVGDFEPKCKFTIANSIDYFTVDNDKVYGRTNAHGLLVDEQGRSVRMIIGGYIQMNDDILPLVHGLPDAQTAPFGHGMETFTFETGHPEYKALETMTFAGSLRFTKVDDVRTGVEVRISQVLPGTGLK
ncbi:hypothetical protein F4803DRAFT_517078 [Xylaria telfairii]|nr:hypothetical protein F4803DRAFT_517078 [Xylaria telfairii]